MTPYQDLGYETRSLDGEKRDYGKRDISEAIVVENFFRFSRQ